MPQSTTPDSAVTASSNPNTILSDIAVTANPREKTSHAEPLSMTGAKADHLARLADFLVDADRELIKSVYAHGRPMSEVARLTHTTPEVVRRRLRRLSQRMLTPEFAFVALRHEHWPPRLSMVARVCLLQGRSLRSAATALDLSIHIVRRVRDQAIAMARGADDLRALANPAAPRQLLRERRAAKERS